jgi:predicted AlkP superfamily phosphohydrolase/phosphomutase
VPAEVPGITTNLIEADGFWSAAGRAGVRTIALDAAMAFDRPDSDGARVLAGLGLPDARGEPGDYFVYTTDDPGARPWPDGTETGTTAGNIYRVAWTGERIETRLSGPVDFPARGALRTRMDTLQRRLLDLDARGPQATALREEQRRLKAEYDAFDAADGRNAHRASVPLLIERLGPARARVSIDGQGQELSVGEWSGVYSLAFELNPLVTAHAVTRAQLVRLDGGFELLVGMLHIDPRAPAWWQPISQPAGFAAELAGWLGAPYETVGWGCLTNPMKDARIPVDSFLQDVEAKLAWREALTLTVLARDDWDVLYSVFSVTDRVQHVLYRHYDAGHPGHDPAEAARETRFFGEPTALRDVIPAVYRQMDRVVGEVMAGMRADDTLLLCADHGFASFRREVHVNNWLAEQGFLAVRTDAGEAGARRLDASVIDWSRTQAYAVGLGGVYLNLKGRERMGIVEPDAAGAVLEAIRAAFLATVEQLPDGTRARVGHDAPVLGELYPGPFKERCADLALGFAEPYRISWATARGEVLVQAGADGRTLAAPVYQDNRDVWSGDHASVSPDIVTGIFFSSEPVVVPASGLSVLHVAPTILDRLGVEIPTDYDEAPLPRR